MSFISPMLAAPMPASFDVTPDTWVAEEKYDGIRIVAEVTHDSYLFGKERVKTWSRYGNNHIVPDHIIDALRHLPKGVYDGELRIPGLRSYGVAKLINGPKLMYTVFDVLYLYDKFTTELPYKYRRRLVTEIFEANIPPAVTPASSVPIRNLSHAYDLCKQIWARDGEGLILKNTKAQYYPGKRPKNVFVKMKQLRSAVMTVIGFESGKYGPYARVSLVDADGVALTVKARNADERARFEMAATTSPHPAIGRKLRIEYQERTPDNSYRHPRWDRWE